MCETHGRVSLAGGLAHGNTGTERRYGRVNTWQSRLRVEVSEEGEASTIADTLSPPYPTPCYRQCRSAQEVLAPRQLDQRRCPSASSIAWTRWASTETPDTGHATTRRTSTAEHRKPLTSESLVHSHTRYLVRGPDCLEAPRAHQIIWWGGHQISGSSWKLQVALQGPDIWSEVTRYLAGAPGRYLVGR